MYWQSWFIFIFVNKRLQIFKAKLGFAKFSVVSKYCNLYWRSANIPPDEWQIQHIYKRPCQVFATPSLEWGCFLGMRRRIMGKIIDTGWKRCDGEVFKMSWKEISVRRNFFFLSYCRGLSSKNMIYRETYSNIVISFYIFERNVKSIEETLPRKTFRFCILPGHSIVSWSLFMTWT